MLRSSLTLHLIFTLLASAGAQDTLRTYPDDDNPGIAFSIGSWQSRTALNSLNGFISGGKDFPTPRMLYGGGMQVYTRRAVWDIEMVFSGNYRRKPSVYEQLALSEARIVFGGMYAVAGNDKYRLQTGLNMGLGSFTMSYYNDSFMPPGSLPGTGTGTFRNRSVSEDYYNNAFLLIPRIQLLLIPTKFMAVSLGAGYQLDVGSGLWTFQQNLQLDPGPVTKQNGLSFQVGLHFGTRFGRPPAGMRF